MASKMFKVVLDAPKQDVMLFLKNPLLHYLYYGTRKVDDYNAEHLYKTQPCYVVYLEDKPFMCIRTLKMTAKLLDIHIYVHPEFWGSGLKYIGFNLFLETLRQKTKYTQVMSMIPESNRHVIKFVENPLIGGQCSGRIQAAYDRNGIQSDLLVYTKKLYED